MEVNYVSLIGGPARRRVSKLVRNLEAIAQEVDTPYLWAGVSLAQGVAAYMSGEWKRGGELCDRAVDIFRTRCTGVTLTVEIDSSMLFSLWTLQFRGEIAELGRRWPAVLKEARDRGDRHVVTILNTLLMSTLRLAADDLSEAEATVRLALGDWTRRGFQIQHNEWCGALVQNKLYRGDGQGAWSFVETQYAPMLAQSHLTHLQKIRIFFYERRARTALAAAKELSDRGALLRAADARRPAAGSRGHAVVEGARLPHQGRNRRGPGRDLTGRDLVRPGGQRARGRGYEPLRCRLAPPLRRDHRGRRGSSPGGKGRFVDEAADDPEPSPHGGCVRARRLVRIGLLLIRQVSAPRLLPLGRQCLRACSF